jgi:transglutaminase-like putative cysteine protease
MTAISRFLTAAVFAAAIATSLSAEEPAPKLDVDAPSQAERSDPITHDVDFSVVVTPPYDCKLLRIWLPLPPSDETQEVKNSFFTAFPDKVEMQVAQEPVYGNRFAYFEYHNPRGAQIIRHRFTAKVWDLHWNLDPEKVATIEKWPAEFEPYLKPHPIVEEQRFAELLRGLAPQAAGSGQRLFRAMDWIDGNLRYDHADASLRADPVHAFTKLRGHCSDYHGLCETIARALGYPTRVTYGLSLYPKNSPSHCKLEAYLPPYGWVSFDLSETQKLVRAIQSDGKLADTEKDRLIAAARARLHAGFRENSWLLVTRGTDYHLAPKASRPVRVVRTIYAEADGEPLPEPDPADAKRREFGWMTVHKYEADKPFSLPFKDYATLIQDAE